MGGCGEELVAAGGGGPPWGARGGGGAAAGDAGGGADALVHAVREVELGSQAAELLGGVVIRLRGFLRGVVGAKPDARCFLRVANLRGPFAPGALAHAAVLASLGGLRGCVLVAGRSRVREALALVVPAPLHLQLCQGEREKITSQERQPPKENINQVQYTALPQSHNRKLG
jgi:hypothetical protein